MDRNTIALSAADLLKAVNPNPDPRLLEAVTVEGDHLAVERRLHWLTEIPDCTVIEEQSAVAKVNPHSIPNPEPSPNRIPYPATVSVSTLQLPHASLPANIIAASMT